MKNKKTIFSALLLGFILVGCATSADMMNEIHVGMTKGEVLGVLGDPVFTEAKDHHEVLVFNLSESRVAEAMFGGVARAQNIGKNHYRVELDDGKVTSYYRAEGR